MYCVDHAMREQLVTATQLHDGRSVCTMHAATDGPPDSSIVSDGHERRCAKCRQIPHRAYFIVRDRPRCIRHAADDVFEHDDMGAHDMAHAAYLRLKLHGVTDAY